MTLIANNKKELNEIIKKYGNFPNIFYPSAPGHVITFPVEVTILNEGESC